MTVDRTMRVRALVMSAAGFWCLQSGLASAADTSVVRAKDAPSVIESYFSDDMIEHAVPLPFYDEENDPDAMPSYWLESDDSLGPPGSTKSGAPRQAGQDEKFEGASGNDDAVDADQSGGGFFDLDSETGIDFGTIDKFDSYPGYKEKWANKQYPWRAIGTLYFSTGSGTASCSASVIGRRDAIVTAAHCCYNRSSGRWNSNFVFVPGKDRTSEPYGRFAYTSARVLNAWISSGGRQNDVCVIKTRTGLSSATGWLGRSWNQPQTEHVFTFGYPGNKDNGLRQNVCASENYPNCGSSLVNATGCDKTFGDSGAPWIRVYRPRETGAKNYVNSVTSGWDSCTGSFGKSYNGARFTSNNIVPLCNDSVCD
jgi:V8-like Glu-specific endopeptidase